MAARGTFLSLVAGVVLQAHQAACFSTIALLPLRTAHIRSQASRTAEAEPPAAAQPAVTAPAQASPVGVHTRWTRRGTHCGRGVAPMAATTRRSTAASLLRLQAVEDPAAAEREPDAIDLDIETQASGHIHEHMRPDTRYL